MLLALLPYLTVVANLALVLAVILGLSQRVRQLRARASQQEKTLEAETTRVSGEMADLKNRMSELERELEQARHASDTTLPASPVASSVNHTLRSKVLKMHRLGQSADRIAGSLRVAQGEVDLLVKVHKIVMRPYEGRPYEGVVLSPLGGESGEKA